jgi:hypothetical protein|tara:strand:+ start:70 stop:246 length:177 start_codon:yes stop_codon:yes gene_type:complete
MDWIIANWGQITQIIVSVVGVAAIIATMTPNSSDNKAVDFLLNIVNAVGGNVGKAKNG